MIYYTGNVIFKFLFVDQDLNRLNVVASSRDPSPRSDHVQNRAPRKSKKRLRNRDRDQSRKKPNLVPSPLNKKQRNRTTKASMSLVTKVRRGMVTKRMLMRRTLSRLNLIGYIINDECQVFLSTYLNSKFYYLFLLVLHCI